MKISQELEEEFDKFMDWYDDKKDYVTSLSARVFAQHWANKQEQGKWVEFDPEDESTWPDVEYDDQFVTNVGVLAFDNGDWLTLDTDSYYTNRPASGVTHWQPLPTPPSEVEV